jgi:hypothetical protein
MALMPDPQPTSPGEVLRRMKHLADEAGVELAPGMTHKNLKTSADRADYILSVIYNTVCYELTNGRIPDLWFKDKDAAWLRSAMRGDAPFQSRYNQTLEAFAKEGIVVDFEEVGRDDETNSEVLKVLVAPTAELDEEAGPRPSM